jgi:hypothetical protein
VNDRIWQMLAELKADGALVQAVLEVHTGILRSYLAADPMLNLGLPVEVRALRRIDVWRVLLLLTPWMLARLLFPQGAPGFEIPPGWSLEERRNADYCVLGPNLGFDLLGQPQRAHLNFHPRLGHYLLQPICLDMKPYGSADAVFEAWSQVIRIRDENMEKASRDCPLQKEISRRELFRQVTGQKAGKDENKI